MSSSQTGSRLPTRRSVIAGAIGASTPWLLAHRSIGKPDRSRRVGIIGLDTSHAIAFTRLLNGKAEAFESKGYHVVAAYPYGSRTIESSVKRLPKYTEQIREMGVELVKSIDALIERVDVVLLETNDGRLHLEQAMPVLKAGKPVFIDKPIAANLTDVLSIYRAAETHRTPVFTSSALRYATGIAAVRAGEHGRVNGVAAWSPMSIEPNHPDLYRYGIHGVEMLFAAFGRGCQTVRRVAGDVNDLTVGRWEDGRIGTFRGLRKGPHSYGGIAYTEKASVELGGFAGYEPLVAAIVDFWSTGRVPFSVAESVELYAFMSAADESKRRGGRSVRVADVLEQAERNVAKRLESFGN